MRRIPSESAEPHAPQSTAVLRSKLPSNVGFSRRSPPLHRELPLAALLELGHRLGAGLGPLAPRRSLRPLRAPSPHVAFPVFSFALGLRYDPPVRIRPAGAR